MVTDGGTVDDYSYNQATWDGLQRLEKLSNATVVYRRAESLTTANFLAEISRLYNDGYYTIVTSGFVFETAIFKAQNRYRSARFLLIDGSPNNGAFDNSRLERIGRSTVAVFFSEEQAGFIAGVASAVQMKKAAFGFIGGMEIPPVQKYSWGFQQGVQYANTNFGTQITMNPEDIIYQGTFSDVAAGRSLAATLYRRGVSVIFAVAGGVGWGVMQEAKARINSGAFVVGVDVDQYAAGQVGGRSVVLTSAIKKISNVIVSILGPEAAQFPGGKLLIFDASSDGVGLPDENPNLGPEALSAVSTVTSRLKEGSIVVRPNANFVKPSTRPRAQ